MITYIAAGLLAVAVHAVKLEKHPYWGNIKEGGNCDNAWTYCKMFDPKEWDDCNAHYGCDIEDDGEDEELAGDDY